MPKVNKRKQKKKRSASKVLKDAALGRHAFRKQSGKGRGSSKKKGRRRVARGSWLSELRKKYLDWRHRMSQLRLLIMGGGLAAGFAVFYIMWTVGVFADFAAKVDRQAQGLVAAVGFSVQQVRVEGRNRTDVEAVKAALDVDQGASIFHYDVEAARERLEGLDWVEEAQVIRFLPKTIHVVLIERNPVALWQVNKQHYLIDRSGFVIGRPDRDQIRELPLFVGVGAAEDAGELLDIMAKRAELMEQTAALIRVGGRRWNLRLINGMDIRLPAENVHEALDRIVELDQKTKLSSLSYAAIDLRLPDRMFVTLKGEQAEQLRAPGMDT